MKRALHQSVVQAVLLTVAALGVLAAPAAANTLPTIYTTKDAYVDQYVPNQKFGTQPWLRVSNGYGADPNSKWAKRTLVWFDLSSIPAGATINSATLSLYYYGYWDTNPQGRKLECWFVWDDWYETTVKWNNAPIDYYYCTYGCYANVPTSYKYMSWDVTDYVRLIRTWGWHNGGFSIEDNTKWGKLNIPVALFHSREYGSLAPKLDVTYTPRSGAGTDGSGTDGVSPAGDSGEVDVTDQLLAGDLNCDGVVDFDDVDPFAAALNDPDSYQAAYPDCDRLQADTTGDGRVDLEDLDAFVAMLRSD